ncbi:hypothetical protein [Candidatus Pelagibacter sp. HIMB109]|uniref:hypothetical protein n=1 Tax=Candidatus Pelagibacter sp. HIMB109 TaxID=3415412 RepID=UPI003F83A945
MNDFICPECGSKDRGLVTHNLGNIRRRKKDLTTGKNHAMFCLLVNIVLGS